MWITPHVRLQDASPPVHFHRLFWCMLSSPRIPCPESLVQSMAWLGLVASCTGRRKAQSLYRRGRVLVFMCIFQGTSVSGYEADTHVHVSTGVIVCSPHSPCIFVTQASLLLLFRGSVYLEPLCEWICLFPLAQGRVSCVC